MYQDGKQVDEGRRSDRPKPEWIEVKVLRDGDYFVRITQAKGMKRFSFDVGQQRPERDPMRYISVWVENGSPAVVRPFAEIIAKLLRDAEAWIQQEAQKLEDAYQARHAQRDDEPDGGRRDRRESRKQKRGDRGFRKYGE